MPEGASRPLIVGLGRLATQKVFDDLLAAFALGADEFPAWSLVILGEGPLRGELEAQALNLGIADRVYLPGAVPNP